MERFAAIDAAHRLNDATSRSVALELRLQSVGAGLHAMLMADRPDIARLCGRSW